MNFKSAMMIRCCHKEGKTTIYQIKSYQSELLIHCRSAMRVINASGIFQCNEVNISVCNCKYPAALISIQKNTGEALVKINLKLKFTVSLHG